MFSSLRSRLWLTYAITIISTLMVVALVFLIFLLGNPLAYRQVRQRLLSAQTQLLANQAKWSDLSPEKLQVRLAAQDENLGVRLLIISQKRFVIADSRAEKAASFEARPFFRIFRLNQTVSDAQGQPWLYVSHKLDNGNFLVTAVPRPQFSYWNILTDELMTPLLWGAMLALILALFIAFWMANWVAYPLQQVITAAHQFSGGPAKLLVLQGPKEVKELVAAFNQMTLRVQASQQAQREFVADVSHELKTPLTSIQGFSQAMLDGTAVSPQEQKQAAQVIFAESVRMYRMVLDLLDLARLDSGIADLKREPVQLAALLKSVAERITPQVRAAGVTLQVQVDEAPVIVGDGDRLAQVFTNLLDNALKFTPASGRVSITARRLGDAVEVAIADTGAGIPDDSLARIYDRFYRVDASRQPGKKQGAGLGLAIVREIVSAHGGKITVRSALGLGSEFIVRIPLSNPDAPTDVHRKK